MTDFKEVLETYKTKREDLFKRRDRIFQQIEEIDQQIADYDVAIRVTQEIASPQSALPIVAGSMLTPDPKKIAVLADGEEIDFGTMSIAEAAIQCLGAHKKSMKAEEIAAWLITHGFKTESKDFEATVYGTLTRTKGRRFTCRKARWSVHPTRTAHR